MTLADFEVKFKCHAFNVSPGVVALIPKAGTIEELRERSRDLRPVAVMFLYYATLEEYEASKYPE